MINLLSLFIGTNHIRGVFPSHLFVKKLGWDKEQFFYLCAGLLD